jgi:hypothetical protein
MTLRPGVVSPGVAEVSALACVVTTAVAHATGCPPFNFTARLAIAVRRGTADAGTSWPGLAVAGRWLVATVVPLAEPQATATNSGRKPSRHRGNLRMTIGRLIFEDGSAKSTCDPGPVEPSPAGRRPRSGHAVRRRIPAERSRTVTQRRSSAAQTVKTISVR